jgi:hypothetical protein
MPDTGPDFIIGFPEGTIPDATVEEVNRRRMKFEFIDHERKIDRAKIHFVNDDRFLLDSPVFRKGTVITVSWGYADRLAPARAMVVTKAGSWNPFVVELKSSAVLMTRDRISYFYQAMTYGEIVTTVAERNGFKGAALFIEETTERMDVSQVRESDAAFVSRLALKTGRVFYIDPDGFHWEKRGLNTRPIRTIRYGDQIGGKSDVVGTPNVKDNLLGLASSVRVATEDENSDASDTSVNRDGLARINELAENRDIDTVAAGAGSSAGDINLTGKTFGKGRAGVGGTAVPKQSFGDAQRPERRVAGTEVDYDVDGRPMERAKSKYLLGQELSGKMELSIIGDPLVSAKSVIALEGFSAAYDGPWWVRGATHQISTSGYVTSLDLARDGHQGKLGRGDSKYDIGGGRPGQRTRGRGADGVPFSAGGDLVTLKLADLKLATFQRATGATTVAFLALDSKTRFVQKEWGSNGTSALPQVRNLVRDAKRVGRVNNDTVLITVAEELLRATESIEPIEAESRARINTSKPEEDIIFGLESPVVTTDSEGRTALSYRPRGARLER